MKQTKTLYIKNSNSKLEVFVHGLRKRKEESLKELKELREKREQAFTYELSHK